MEDIIHCLDFLWTVYKRGESGIYLNASCCSWKLDNWMEPVCSWTLNRTKATKLWENVKSGKTVENNEWIWLVDTFTDVKSLSAPCVFIQGLQAGMFLPVLIKRGQCWWTPLLFYCGNQQSTNLPTGIEEGPDFYIFCGLQCIMQRKISIVLNQKGRTLLKTVHFWGNVGLLLL